MVQQRGSDGPVPVEPPPCDRRPRWKVVIQRVVAQLKYTIFIGAEESPEIPVNLLPLVENVVDLYTKTVVIGFSRRSEEHTSELQSLAYLVCRLLLEKKKHKQTKLY